MIKPDKEVLVSLYEMQGFTAQQVGDTFGVSKREALRWLQFYNIERRPMGRGLVTRGQSIPTREELMRWIYEEHLSYQDIADKYSTTKQAVTYWLKKHGIPHPHYWASRRKGNVPVLPTKEEFLELYEQGWPVSYIADSFNVPFDTLMCFCKREHIQLRTNAWRNGAVYECLDGHRALSVYEQQVDNWLFTHNIEHIVEPSLPFDRRYRADFLANGWYIEIWGVRNNLSYAKRKILKQKAYKEHQLPLIEIHLHHFDKRHNSSWERHLQAVLSSP